MPQTWTALPTATPNRLEAHADSDSPLNRQQEAAPKLNETREPVQSVLTNDSAAKPRAQPDLPVAAAKSTAGELRVPEDGATASEPTAVSAVQTLDPRRPRAPDTIEPDADWEVLQRETKRLPVPWVACKIVVLAGFTTGTRTSARPSGSLQRQIRKLAPRHLARGMGGMLTAKRIRSAWLSTRRCLT